MNAVSPTITTDGSHRTGQAGFTPPGREDFLNLLVTQLRHQDPLNPLEGADFAAQLAQFSSVEELRHINNRLDNNLQADMLMAQSVNNTMAATLIGKEVQAVNDTIKIDGQGGVSITFDLAERASDISIEIIDSTGRLIDTIAITDRGAGLNSVQWDGRDRSGARVPAGDYRVKITANGRDGAAVTATPLTIGRVDAVKFVDGNPVLMVGGREINFGSVVQIRAAVPEDNAGRWLRRLWEQ